MKHLFFFLISQDYAASSVFGMIGFFSHVSEAEVAELLSTKPIQINSWWALARSRNYHPKVYVSLKALLRFLCGHHINGWSLSYLDFLSSLPNPAADKYASVRTGEVFLSVEEEATVVHHLDELASILLSAPSSIDDVALLKGGTLLCSYLFGMRPTQIATLSMRDVRIWDELGEEVPTVHLVFRMVKQRSKSKSFPITRKIKQDWTPIIIEQYKRGRAKGLEGSDRLFEIDSAQGMSRFC